MTIFGGFDSSGLPLPDFYVLSLPANTAQFAWNSPTLITVSPGLRQWHTSIHDPLSPRMVTFGGVDDDPFLDGTATNGETWTLIPGLTNSWKQLTFASTPPPRQGHVAVYDSLNLRMMIFGGGDTVGPLNPPDMWTLNLGSPATWSLLTPSGTAPAPRQYHSAVYDTLNKRMVVYGQETATLVFTDGVWWINP